MSEVIGVVSTVGSLCVSLGALYYVKRSLSTENILMRFDDILSAVSQDTELQKKIYIIGGVLGQGIKAGIGLTGRGTGGKFGMNDIIGSLIGRFFGGMGGGGQEQPQQQQSGGGANPFDTVMKGH